MKKLFKFIAIMLLIVLLIWVFASWQEVVSQNVKLITPIYSEWNIFTLIFKLKEILTK